MKGEPSTRRPMVSVILATYNEAGHIEQCMTSLLKQETPGFDLEILAIDGKSRDGTLELLRRVAARDPRVRVLVNEKRRTPFAFNLGLREARGEYVCIFGAHTIYTKDYIAACLAELKAQGAVGCGGRVVTRPANPSRQARLVAWALSHPFGSSRKSFRTQPEGFVDTVNYPVMRKQALLEAGGYSEKLARNQDNDLNQKLRARGHQLYCTWKTRCTYHPNSTLRDLFRYARGNGFWNVVSLEHNAESMGARHFIPFLFLLGLLATAVLGVAGIFLPAPYRLMASVPFFGLLGLHLGAAKIAACQVAVRERSAEALWLPGIFLGFHVAYGYGSLVGLITHRRALVVLARAWLASRRQAGTPAEEGLGRPGAVREPQRVPEEAASCPWAPLRTIPSPGDEQ